MHFGKHSADQFYPLPLESGKNTIIVWTGTFGNHIFTPLVMYIPNKKEFVIGESIKCKTRVGIEKFLVKLLPSLALCTVVILRFAFLELKSFLVRRKLVYAKFVFLVFHALQIRLKIFRDCRSDHERGFDG